MITILAEATPASVTARLNELDGTTLTGDTAREIARMVTDQCKGVYESRVPFVVRLVETAFGTFVRGIIKHDQSLYFSATPIEKVINTSMTATQAYSVIREYVADMEEAMYDITSGIYVRKAKAVKTMNTRPHLLA